MIDTRSYQYRRALTVPHRSYVRVQVERAGSVVGTLAPEPVDELAARSGSYSVQASRSGTFFGGSVQATLGSQVTRRCTLSVPDSLYPYSPDDLLTPLGNHLRIVWGLEYGNGAVDEFPLFKGPILDVTPSERGRATVRAADMAVEVSANGFGSPQSGQTGALVLDEFVRLVQEATPLATFGQSDDLAERVPVISYEMDRGRALDELAKVAGAYWYSLANGDFVMRRVPWLRDRLPVLSMRDGEGGTIIQAYPLRSREGVYNRVTVLGERPDGGPVASYTASDLDPTSPTYVNGPYGVKSIQLVTRSAQIAAQLRTLAEAVLQRSRGLTDAWRVECVADGTIELGDPLGLSVGGRPPVTQVVAGYSFPLDGGNMTLDCRGVEPEVLA